MGRLDQLIRRLDSARSWDVLSATAETKGPLGGYARDVLTMPRAQLTLEGVDDFLRQHGGRMGEPLGRGRESMVFAVHGDDDSVAQVLKLQSPGAGRGFTLPMGVPGVAGYAAKERFPTGLQVAIQDRAARVLPANVRDRWGGIAEEGRWVDMANDLQKSLAARGFEWSDPHSGNVGVMRDGNMAVIDGAIFPMDALEAARSAPMSAEDAIRLLVAPKRYR